MFKNHWIHGSLLATLLLGLTLGGVTGTAKAAPEDYVYVGTYYASGYEAGYCYAQVSLFNTANRPVSVKIRRREMGTNNVETWWVNVDAQDKAFLHCESNNATSYEYRIMIVNWAG